MTKSLKNVKNEKCTLKDLESDYILDLHIVDGIDHLPDELQLVEAERS